MTEEIKYLVRAVNALADARVYIGHVEQIKRAEGKAHSAGQLNVIKAEILNAYDHVSGLVEVWR